MTTRKFRIKKTTKHGNVTYTPQEYVSILLGLIKYWATFPEYDYHKTFCTIDAAQKFIDNIEDYEQQETEYL